jgi:glycerophosphoryl diester phosphodiesterase
VRCRAGAGQTPTRGRGRLTEICAHRGGALLWPENSRVAFENTTRLAVEQVEFDVHPSRDGKLVVIHDATLDRTTDASGPVSALDWAALKRVVLKGTGGQRMLLLDEVIEIFRPTPINLRLEIKAGPNRVPYPGLPGKIVAARKRMRMLERTVITSFQLGTAVEAAEGGARRHVWLVTPEAQRDIGPDQVIAVARDNKIPMLGLRHGMLDAAVVATVRASGLGIGGWACNEAASIARMFVLGVDVFTTDRPDLAIALRRRRRRGAK